MIVQALMRESYKEASLLVLSTAPNRFLTVGWIKPPVGFASDRISRQTGETSYFVRELAVK
jgi:hypothetical protein